MSHIVHAGEGSPLRVVVQPAGVPDKSTLELQTTDLVAELRAEVAHWYEGLQARSLLAPTSAQSTPVLGSLLAEGPIRIITQGQELNPDFDEKTLQEMGFKDNQVRQANKDFFRIGLIKLTVFSTFYANEQYNLVRINNSSGDKTKM